MIRDWMILAGFVALVSAIAWVGEAHADDDLMRSPEVQDRLGAMRVKLGLNTRKLVRTDNTPNDESMVSAATQRAWRTVPYAAMSTVTATESMPRPTLSRTEGEVAEVDKLGYQISDATLRGKVLELYRRPDIVVKQYTLGQ